MANKRWRFLLVPLLTSSLALLAACSGGIDFDIPDAAVDAGPDVTVLDAAFDEDVRDGSTVFDGGVNDAQSDDSGDGGLDASDASKPDTGTPAKITFVNGVTSLGASDPSNNGGVRLCFATATKLNPQDSDFAPTPLGATPETATAGQPYPGIFIGSGGPTLNFGVPLQQLTIRPYLMNAYRLAQGGVVGTDATTPRCSKLLAAGTTYPVGGQTLVAGVDYWRLADIPAGTLKQDHSYLFGAVGCSSDGVTNASNVTSCGEGYTPTGSTGVGNLKLLVLDLDTTSSVAGTEFGVQNVHLSPSSQNAKATNALQPFKPTVVNRDVGTGNPSTTSKHAASPGGGEVEYSTSITKPTTVVKIQGLVTDTGYFAYAPSTNGGNANPFAPLSLNNKGAMPSVQSDSTGETNANATVRYTNGNIYTFVLVGDPGVSTGGKRLHYLAFPNK